MNKIKIALAIYAAAGVFTFGYAADWRWDYNDEATCLAGENYDIKVGCTGMLWPPVAGVFGAALWPLYWSWELQS